MCLAVYVLLITAAVGEIRSENVVIRCEDGDFIESVDCTYTESGIYTLLNLEPSITTIRFDRLTNSKVNIPYHVKKLVINFAIFDLLPPCGHVISDHDVVVLFEGHQSKCVSVNFVLNNITYWLTL